MNLLLMGTLGRQGVSRLIVGNTFEAIADEVDCSLIAVKRRGAAPHPWRAMARVCLDQVSALERLESREYGICAACGSADFRTLLVDAWLVAPHRRAEAASVHQLGAAPPGLSRSMRMPLADRSMSCSSRRTRVSSFFALMIQNIISFR